MMDVDSTHASRSPISHSSRGIKLVLLIVAIIFQACQCSGAEAEAQAGPKTPEIVEAIGNEFDSPSHLILLEPSSHFGPLDDIPQLKRHLGAIAALSGSRQITGSRSIIPPSKKHVGSVAAAVAGGRLSGKRLDLFTPSYEQDVYKRHLGAVMALSGAKAKPLTRSLKESLAEYQMDSSATSENLMGSTNGREAAYLRTTPDFGTEEIRSSPSDPLYGNEPSLLSLVENDMDGTDVASDEDNDQTISLKSKRFLGSLARGGWFPRHFRGVISENSFGKRHIGSLARLGWMPHAKQGNSRLSLLMEDQRGEGIGLKRNDLATRRRMLYHFTAPSLWTSPRGK